jgi:hypothetical protein
MFYRKVDAEVNTVLLLGYLISEGKFNKGVLKTRVSPLTGTIEHSNNA